jgi:hypothetical protein
MDFEYFFAEVGEKGQDHSAEGRKHDEKGRGRRHLMGYSIAP